MLCYDFAPPQYLFFAEEVPGLLYYSHIPVIILALLIGFFIFISGPKNLLNRLFASIAICFSFWTIINLILWTNVHSEYLLFYWSHLGILQGLVAIQSIYFVYVFLNNKDLRMRYKLVLFGLLLPVLLLSVTNLHLSGYNITDCDAFGYEGVLFHAYYTSLGIVAMLSILYMIIHGYRRATTQFKKQILLTGIGIELFLASFFLLVFLASYLTDLGISKDSEFEMYGLFGMIIFMILITIQIVKFRTFKINLATVNALVIGLVLLVASQFTYIETKVGAILAGITLVLTIVAGIVLIRSVKKEVKQRKELEILTAQLETANDRLRELDKAKSEFVSIASHQLRSPLTAIRGYASMLVEGSFGQLPQKALEVAKRIEDSTKLMAMSIEDYLNVSRIESGNMKYNLSDFNLYEMTSGICDDLRPEALKQNLILLFRSDITSKGMVNADVGKTHQIIHNLINNSIKYTQKGSISVFVREDIKAKRIYVDISDTGIGMSQKTIDSLFQKFSRADNANSVNTSGTGLGLYVAVKMAEAMSGSISAHSEGDGKGSTFTFELPLKV